MKNIFSFFDSIKYKSFFLKEKNIKYLWFIYFLSNWADLKYHLIEIQLFFKEYCKSLEKKMKYLVNFLLVLLFLSLVIDKKIESISVVKLSRLNKNLLKKLIAFRRIEEPKLDQNYRHEEHNKINKWWKRRKLEKFF